MSYNQLAERERYQIEILLKTGKSKREIAAVLGCSPSTIYREVSRNSQRGSYCGFEAQQQLKRRKQCAARPWKMTTEFAARIEILIREDWSPEQISGYLRVVEGVLISHERIYRHVWQDRAYGGDLYISLRRGGKRYRRHRGNGASKSRIPNRIGIELRPEIVDERARVGDWEVDTIIGTRRGAALVTLVERKSRYTLTGKVERRYADLVRETIISLLAEHEGKLYTMTADNGPEFSEHERVSESLKMGFYFARPHSPWERGSNENTNGLIRQYLPKGTSLDDLTEWDLEWIMDRLNHRPRKCLGYRTPHEVFYNEAVREAA